MNRETAVQFSRFLLIGFANTAIDFVSYFALTRTIPFLGAYPTAGKVLSYIIALTFSYFANSTWTFEQPFSHRKLLLFYSTVGTGIFINTGVYYVSFRVLGINDLVAVLLAAVGTAIWGFTWAKLAVFR